MKRTSTEASGLRKRPTFEGIVEYIANGQETIKYPDRLAKFMRNHPYLTQLDGEGIMEMQDQQEETWKAQEKEHRIKILKTERSAPEMRATHDRGVQVDEELEGFITNGDWDAAIANADELIGARSRAISSELRGKRENISQTIGYINREQERSGDIGHAMNIDAFESPEGSMQPVSKRGRSTSSRPEDPSSSSGGGPPPPPPPSTGKKIIGAMATTGNVAMNALKFGWGTWREVSDAMRGPVAAFADMGNRIQGDPWSNPPGDYRGFDYAPRRRSPSVAPARATRSVTIPVEAPRPKSRARAPSRTPSSQSRGRARQRTAADVEEGIVGGRRVQPNVRRLARAFTSARVGV